MSSPPSHPQEWYRSEIHRLVITPTSTAEKQKIYAQWASDYDADTTEMGYEAPQISVSVLLSHMPPPDRTSEKLLRVVDAGCGTGYCGEQLRKFRSDVRVTGVDFSKEMLEEARKRGVYEELVQADLNVGVPVGGADFVVATGVFLEGHCGPEALPNVLGCLKVGGVAVVSVREVSFEARKEEYLKWIEVGGGKVVENRILEYIKGEVRANYVVVRREGKQ